MSAQNRETRKMVRVSAAKKWQGTDMWVTCNLFIWQMDG